MMLRERALMKEMQSDNKQIEAREKFLQAFNDISLRLNKDNANKHTEPEQHSNFFKQIFSKNPKIGSV